MAETYYKVCLELLDESAESAEREPYLTNSPLRALEMGRWIKGTTKAPYKITYFETKNPKAKELDEKERISESDLVEKAVKEMASKKLARTWGL